MKVCHSINDAMNLATAKTGMQGWQAYRWIAVDFGSDCIVHGCVPSGVYTRGPRKGRPRFSQPVIGTHRVVVVSGQELDSAAEVYERDHGKCWECKGEGKVIAGSHVTEGPRYAECKRCHGNGLAEAKP